MNTRLKFLMASVGVLGACASANATWYTNEADFLAAISPTHYLEDFNGWTGGSPLNGNPSWAAPGANGYGWTASAPNGLYSLDSCISTSSPFKLLTFEFSGLPVTAFGLMIGNSNQDGSFLAGDSVVKLSNGETKTITQGATQSFLGWAGSDTLTSAQIVASNWVRGDHIYTTGPVPEPATLAILGIGAIALIRRGKKNIDKTIPIN